MNGNHRPEGVWLCSEPLADARAVSLLDVAPTVLAAMGVPAPWMEGRSLIAGTGAEAPAATADPPPAAANPEQPYTPEEERALEERLRALGYLE